MSVLADIAVLTKIISEVKMGIASLKRRNFMKRIMMSIAISLFVLMVPLATSSYGAVIVIPDNYSTIQEGIDAAVNGDTVLVRDGIYLLTAAIDFKGKAITVESENGAVNCILDGQNATRVAYFHSGESNTSVLQGFTIRNGNATQGAGIYSSASSPVISNCTITANLASGGSSFGGGIFINGGYPTIDHSVISYNQSSGTWYGYGGGIYVDASSPIIQNSDVSNNSASGGNSSAGGGIYFTSTTFPRLENCVISSNSPGGIYFSGSANFPGLTNCTIARNIGGGVYFDNTSTDIINSILWENSPQNIYTSGTSNPNITYSDVGGGYEGPGNIDAPPAFANIAQANFHLTGSSPCINAGSNAAPYLPLLDKDGNARIDGPRVDMGAYEYKYAYLAAGLTVFRPNTGIWYTLYRSSPPAFSSTQWGLSSDILVPGDYNGDGKVEYAVWRPASGIWYILNEPGSYSCAYWGKEGDTPVPADYDLDGKTDIAVWRPSEGVWYILPSNSPGTYTATKWGMEGDVPIPPALGILRSIP
jgi:parallel beta-helix repeat protein